MSKMNAVQLPQPAGISKLSSGRSRRRDLDKSGFALKPVGLDTLRGLENMLAPIDVKFARVCTNREGW